MSTLNLFPPNEGKMLSPKRTWMKKHGVITLYHAPGHCPASWFIGFQEWWPKLKGANFFGQETAEHGDSRCVEADTEEEAFATFARHYEIPLWNEEAAP